MGIAENHVGCPRFDEVGEMSRRKVFAQRANGGGGEDDVANLAKSDEQNPHIPNS
jgi:hypothetical protein